MRPPEACGSAPTHLWTLGRAVGTDEMEGKQGVIQELLTGNKRLPGFSGEWEEKRLEELFNFSPDSLKDFIVKERFILEMGSVSEEGKLLSREDVAVLAKLPGREELTATLVGTIAAPLSGFVRVLNGNVTQLLYALNAIGEKKGQA